MDAAGRAVNEARRRPRRCAALATALCVVAAVQACDSRGAQGWAISTTTWSDSGIPGHDITVVTRSRLLGAKFRITTLGPGAMFGNFMILDSAAATITTVYPKGKLVLISSSRAPVSANPPLITVEAHVDSGYRVEDLGRGEPILGHATHLYRETLGYELRIAAGTDSCKRHRRTVSELWVTTDTGIPDMEAAIRHLSFLPNSMVGINMTRVLAEKRGVTIKGIILKRTSTTHDSVGPSDPVAMHSRWEVTELKHVAIDPDEFRLPSGYKVRDMRGLAPRADSSMRSAGALDAARTVLNRMCPK